MRKEFLIISGSSLLLAGLLLSFNSNRIENRIMGGSRMNRLPGVVYDDKEGGENEKKIKIVDICHWIGQVLAALGIVLNAWGALL